MIHKTYLEEELIVLYEHFINEITRHKMFTTLTPSIFKEQVLDSQAGSKQTA